ncbi:hypothetical protein ACWCQ0_28005 [Streptomyces massasporeus]|uniref:Uncharacterized protein n=1 Tax=Streptomyces massasporeus TaxID=67324 RepID=A0ABW6L7K8_9ACTN
MGAGTFLGEMIDRVAEERSRRGEGFRGEAVEQLAGRLIGFERQMAAYAVAQIFLHAAGRAYCSRIRTDDGQGASTGYVGRSARWMVASAREETPVRVQVIGDRWSPTGRVATLAGVCGPFRTGARR